MKTKRLRRSRPMKKGALYRQLWTIVDGAVRDTFLHHPEYIETRWKMNVRISLNKRIVGALNGCVLTARRVGGVQAPPH